MPILDDLWPDHFIEVLIGLFSAIVVAMTVEIIRKPRLKFAIDNPIDHTYPHGPARFVRVLVSAKIPWKGTRWMIRAPAGRCKAAISFHHLDGRSVFGRDMDGRWANTAEPVRQITDPSGKSVSVLDPERLPQARIEIFPGETVALDIAVKLASDTDCHGWNNEAYLHAWRTPHWKLMTGRYLVRVKVTSSGEVWEEAFLLVNDVPRTDFRLELASSHQKRDLKKNSS
jgi:hypothetical protein